MRAREHVAETLRIVHTVKVVIRRGVDGVTRRYRDVDHRDDHNGHVGLPIPQRSHRLQGFLPAGGMSTRTVNAPPRTPSCGCTLLMRPSA